MSKVENANKSNKSRVIRNIKYSFKDVSFHINKAHKKIKKLLKEKKKIETPSKPKKKFKFNKLKPNL